MKVQTAIIALKKAGYRAYVTAQGEINVEDPVQVTRGPFTTTEYKSVILHPSKVAKFISDRS